MKYTEVRKDTLPKQLHNVQEMIAEIILPAITAFCKASYINFPLLYNAFLPAQIALKVVMLI